VTTDADDELHIMMSTRSSIGIHQPIPLSSRRCWKIGQQSTMKLKVDVSLAS